MVAEILQYTVARWEGELVLLDVAGAVRASSVLKTDSSSWATLPDASQGIKPRLRKKRSKREKQERAMWPCYPNP
jgi:hypothetical protein